MLALALGAPTIERTEPTTKELKLGTSSYTKRSKNKTVTETVESSVLSSSKPGVDETSFRASPEELLPDGDNTTDLNLKIPDGFGKVYKKDSGRQTTTALRTPLPEKNLRQTLIDGIDRLDTEGLRTAMEVLRSSSVSHAFEGAAEVEPALPTVAPALWSERTTGREVSPADFIRAHYSKWIGDAGLSRGHISRLDPVLYNAYSQWIRRNPDGEISNLPSESRTKIDDPKQALEHKRAAGRAAQKRYRIRNVISLDK